MTRNEFPTNKATQEEVAKVLELRAKAQAYDDVSKLLVEELEEVGAEIEARMKNYRKEQSEIIWDTADITNGIFEQTSYGQGLGLKEALEIIDRKIAKVKGDKE